MYKNIFLILLALVLIVNTVACNNKSSNSNASVNTSEEASVESKDNIAHKKKAPDFTLKDITGQEQSLSSFQGKVVLLNFWATWCAPCVAEMPSLERMHKSLADDGFSVVSVNLDPPNANEEVMEFLKKNGITFPVLRDAEFLVPESYGVTGFPESFFIDSEGKFLSFVDPTTKDKSVRIMSDREWDSEQILKAVRSLISMSKAANSVNKTEN